jgi:hypothetical protein
MEMICAGADYYFKQKQHYPSSFAQIRDLLDNFDKTTMTIKNEFTGATYQPQFLESSFDATSNELEGNHYRYTVLSNIERGLPPPGQPPLKPGEIRFYRSVIKYARGPVQAFYGVAADKDGNQLRGSSASVSFFIGSEDGVTVKPKDAERPFDAPFQIRNRMVWMIESNMPDFQQSLVRILPAISCGLLAFCSLAYAFSLPARSEFKLLGFSVAVLSGMATVLYVFGKFLP